ncbi:MAG TPA: hypothetical protein VF618_28495 [Thermoanaerobaculia bacterium]
MSQRTSSTEAGEVNRKTEESKHKGSVDFGEKIGRSEGLSDGNEAVGSGSPGSMSGGGRNEDDGSTDRHSTSTMSTTGKIGDSSEGRH